MDEPPQEHEGFRLSPQQERLWLLMERDGTAPYHSRCRVRIEGELDSDRLTRALRQVVERFEILRTAFRKTADGPVQVLHEHVTVSYERHDLTGLPETLRQRAVEDSDAAFDLGRPPLLRCSLFTLAPREHVLLLTLPALVADRTGLEILAREIVRAYAGEPAGEDPMQYVDLADWQWELLESEDTAEGRDYWAGDVNVPPVSWGFTPGYPMPPSGLKTGPSALEFSFPGQSLAPRSLVRRLPSSLREAVESPEAFFLACWQVLLARVTGAGSLTVGTAFAGRKFEELADAPGLLVRFLPVHARFEDGTRFGDVLARVGEALRERAEWQEYFSWDRIPAPPGDLPQFAFAFEWAPRPEPLRADGLEIEIEESASTTERFQVKLVCDGTRIEVHYDSASVPASVAGRLAGSLLRLAESALEDPDLPIGELDATSRGERHLVLHEWGDALQAPQEERTLHGLFEEQARRTPENVAVRCSDEELTYRELDRRASRLARHLAGLGVGPDTVVGLATERSLGMVVGILGILKAGGAYLPLDPSYPEERLRYLCEDSGVTVIVDDALLGVQEPSPPTPLPEGEGSRSRAGNLAYVIYTSGSTGRPKGVLVEHGHVVRLFTATQEKYRFTETDVWTLFHSFAFDFSVWELWGALLHGGKLVVVPHEVSRTPEKCLELLAEEGVTVFNQTPSAFRQLMAAAQKERHSRRRRLALRYVIFGGEALELESLEPWYELAGDGGPLLVNMYGITETTVHVTWRPLAPKDVHAGSGSLIGRPIPDLGVHLLARGGRPVPVGVAGEIHVGGAGLSRGYLGRGALTARRFVPHPWSPTPGARLYRAGDLARHLPSGELEYLGRLDHQVKIRGFRIELGEVEAACRNHPAVADAVVLLEGESADARRLVACLVPAGDEALETGEVRDFVRGRLPEHMVPASWAVIEKLPLTANGKLDRAALVRLAHPATPSGEYLKPRNEAERILTAIWQELLGVERVGVRDNFFDLGGHSLLVVRMRNRVREAFHREISRTDLFRHPTIEALAAHLAAGDAAPEPARHQVVRGAGRAEMRRSSADRGASAVAVVGMAGRFPGAGDVDELWANLRGGTESISFYTVDELVEAGLPRQLVEHPSYVRASGRLEGEDLFDARLFGIPPREAETLDPQHRIFLECAWEALEYAGYDPETSGKSIGVYAGVGVSKYLLQMVRNPELAGPAGEMQVLLANDKDFLPTRVSYKLDLKGPSVNVQTACSTSLVATHLACRSLLSRECDLALAGGVALLTLGKSGYFYQEDSILSPDGHCRAFDARARGTSIGSGAGVVVLKRLDDALADGDTIHAVIRGSAINNDGAAKIGFTAPGPEGQAAVVAEALSMAGVEASQVSYVETHGSGTALGDPIEVSALREVFGAEPGRRCALGSIKTNIGHTDSAAGAAGLIKTVLALRHREIPASLHFEEPGPEIDFESSPFFVATELTPWEGFGHPGEGGARYAGVSSFGLGGTNVHLVLEEAPTPVPAPPRSPQGDVSSEAGRPWQLLVLSAASEPSLEGATERLASHLEAHPEDDLADVAFTYQVGRKRLALRRFAVCRDTEDAARVLGSRDPNRLVSAAEERLRRPVAFLFPGLGDHYVHMGRELYETEPAFREELDRLAGFLEPRIGADLRTVLFPGARPSPEEPPGKGPDLKKLLGRDREEEATPLDDVRLAHPAICLVELALARLWAEWGVEPEAMIGYSLGEYTAACLAGVWTPEETLELVAERAKLVAELPSGAMLAVPLPEDEVVPLLEGGLAVAAINTPGVTVVSGPAAPVDALERTLEGRGVASRRLNSPHAFHSPAMEPVAERFAECLKRRVGRPPRIPFLSNVTGTWITAEEATDPDYWVRHLLGTVRFAEGVGELLADPDRLLLEVGPGQALGTAARQHPARAESHAVVTSMRDARDPRSDVAVALGALGELWLAGVPADWRGFHRHHRRRRLPLPTYAFDRQRYWLDMSRKEAAPRPRRGKNPELAEWFYVPTWKLSGPPRHSSVFVGQAPPDDSDARFETGESAGGACPTKESAGGACPTKDEIWVLFVDRHGLGVRLAERLAEQGREIVVVAAGEPFAGIEENRATIDLGRSEDYDALFAALRSEERTPRNLVHLLTWKAEPASDLESFEAAQYEGLYSLFFLARALARQGLTEQMQLAVVTDGLHRVDATEELRPEKATMSGALKVIPQEYRNLLCRSIDLGTDGEAAVDRLLADLTEDRRPDRFVAYRKRGRFVESYDPVKLEVTDGAVLRRQGVYLVTGGFGEVGRLVTRHLAETAEARLVLTGRSPMPRRDEWDDWLTRHGADDPVSKKIVHVRALEDAGAEVLAFQADVADPERMRGVVREARERFGALHGVVHLAGELSRDKLFVSLEDAGPETCRPQFRAKVGGLYVLRDVLRGIDLDFCVLFSSLSSILGGLGFSAYAAGNTFMDAFAHAESGAGTFPWLALDWDSWGADEDGGSRPNAGLGSSMAELTMKPSEAVEAFHRTLALAASSQVVVSTGDLASRLDQWVYFAGPVDEKAASPSLHPRPSLATAYEAPEGETETALAELWQEHLGIAEVGRHDNFFQLGGDSLLATQLISRLRSRLSVELPLRTFFTSPTVAQLAMAVDEARHGEEELSEIEKALREIQGLSAEEIAAELQAELSEES